MLERKSRTGTRQTKEINIMNAFCLSCPSATLALQHGDFPLGEWLTAKGLLETMVGQFFFWAVGNGNGHSECTGKGENAQCFAACCSPTMSNYANQMALLLVAKAYWLRSFRVEECSIHLTTRLITATLHWIRKLHVIRSFIDGVKHQ